MKKSNFIYPTLDVSQRNYPKLYPTSTLLCKECNEQPAANFYIGLCPKHTDKITILMNKHCQLFINIIDKHATGMTFDLKSRIEVSSLFNLNSPISQDR